MQRATRRGPLGWLQAFKMLFSGKESYPLFTASSPLIYVVPQMPARNQDSGRLDFMSRFGHKIARCEKIIGHRFKSKLKIAEALNAADPSGSSFVHDGIVLRLRNNARLAVYGDSVADWYLCSLWISRPLLEPAHWNRLRNQVLGNLNLARVGRRLGLQRCINVPLGSELTPGPITDERVATTVEAIMGLVHQEGGLDALGAVMDRLGLTSHELLQGPATTPRKKASKVWKEQAERETGAESREMTDEAFETKPSTGFGDATYEVGEEQGETETEGENWEMTGEVFETKPSTGFGDSNHEVGEEQGKTETEGKNWELTGEVSETEPSSAPVQTTGLSKMKKRNALRAAASRARMASNAKATAPVPVDSSV